jgi:hypothetical protein
VAKLTLGGHVDHPGLNAWFESTNVYRHQRIVADRLAGRRICNQIAPSKKSPGTCRSLAIPSSVALKSRPSRMHNAVIVTETKRRMTERTPSNHVQPCLHADRCGESHRSRMARTTESHRQGAPATPITGYRAGRGRGYGRGLSLGALNTSKTSHRERKQEEEQEYILLGYVFRMDSTFTR